MAGTRARLPPPPPGRRGGPGRAALAMLDADGVRAEMGRSGPHTGPINLNFFCHPPDPDPERMRNWWDRWPRTPPSSGSATRRAAPAGSFDAALCDWRAAAPGGGQLHSATAARVDRVRRRGPVLSRRPRDEARWLDDHGCERGHRAGVEAGDTAGCSYERLTPDRHLALVPQVVDAVTVPVIAAGGIADARGIAAALALGADGVQIGTAFLLTPEATTGPVHRRALERAAGTPSALTNVFTGRPARSLVNRAVRELGPMTGAAPAFPLAVGPMAGLRATAERAGSADFSPLWAGQAAALASRCRPRTSSGPGRRPCRRTEQADRSRQRPLAAGRSVSIEREDGVARTSAKAGQFTESVIRETFRLAAEYGAINLGQGFPDYPCPPELKAAACAAITADDNQYPMTFGTPALRAAIAAKTDRTYPGWTIDPDTELCVTCGATEALVAVTFALLDPGDEVVLFEPWYENYRPNAILSGAVPRLVRLREPDGSSTGELGRVRPADKAVFL